MKSGPTKLLLLALTLFASSFAAAQATRTWVSGVGDDVNPCSRTAPCKTFAGAISKTAEGGEINALDPGGFGTLNITKSITINGEGTMASMLASSTNGIIVNAGPADIVIIRGVSINGAGNPGEVTGLNGIRFLAGGELHVENVKIYGFTQQGIDFVPNGASRLLVSNTSILNTGGIWIRSVGSGTALVTLDKVTMQGNARGIRVEDGAIVMMRDSFITSNDVDGVVTQGTFRAADLTLENVVVSNNFGVGIFANGMGTVRISNTTVTRNNAGLAAVGGGSIVSFGNNRVHSNNSANGPPSVTTPQM